MARNRLANAGGQATFPGRRHRRRPPKLYRIGEVVEYSGVSRQTIHNYTTMGLLQESGWTRGGHRLYDVSVFDRLDEIVDLKAENKSLQEIREHFERRDGS
jgi:DNA-binding transcriptional MerR regulator